MMLIGRSLLFVIMLYVLIACGGGPAPATAPPTAIGPTATDAPIFTEPPADTEEPLAEPSGVAPLAPTLLAPLSVEEQLAKIDAVLKQSTRASIAYNAPAEMQINETVTIELLLNPSLSEQQLKEQVTEPGTVQSSGDVEITPQMKAEIIPADPEAFAIAALHDDPIQMISGTETTKWSWYLTAKKGGSQKVSIVIYRLLKYENKEDWRVVETFKADIHIKVTLLNRIQSLGWTWIVAAIVVLLAIAAFWRWYDQRKPALEQTKRSKQTGWLTGTSKDISGHIFISYRRSDSADIVGRIYDRLVQEFGRKAIFKDVDSIPLGVDFKGFLDERIRECNILLAVIGDRWLNTTDDSGKKRLEDPDDFVRIEIESALEQGLPVIPLLVRGAKMPDEDNLPASLQKLVYRNGIPIRPDPDFHRDMDRLISALEEYVR